MAAETSSSILTTRIDATSARFEANMRAMFKDIDTRLSKHPEVGEYDQKI